MKKLIDRISGLLSEGYHDLTVRLIFTISLFVILPIDLIPDAILGLGFTDDLMALVWALFKMRKYITPEIKRKARERLREWFGPEEGEEFEEFDMSLQRYDPNDPRIIDVEAEEF